MSCKRMVVMTIGFILIAIAITSAILIGGNLVTTGLAMLGGFMAYFGGDES